MYLTKYWSLETVKYCDTMRVNETCYMKYDVIKKSYIRKEIHFKQEICKHLPRNPTDIGINLVLLFYN